MAVPKTLQGTKILVQLGDGGGTETFAHPCLINSDRGIEFSSSTSEQVIPDCTTPDQPGWVNRLVDGLSASVSGSGMLDTASISTFWSWFSTGAAKNVRVKVDTTLANGGGYWAFSARLTGFSVNAPNPRSERATADVSIVSDGVVTWVNASA